MKIPVKKLLYLAEVGVGIYVIAADVLVPTVVILVLMAVAFLLRREKLTTLGFKRPKSWLKMAGIALILAIGMQFIDAGVTMPILNRLTGTTLDYSGFSNLKGNFSQLMVFIIASWTLAALGEEMVYRGYLQNRVGKILADNKMAMLATVAVVAALFGLAHTEQGLIGVVVTTINALFFSWIKHKYDGNLWAAILTHGFYNSVGVIIFFFTGPIYGLW